MDIYSKLPALTDGYLRLLKIEPSSKPATEDPIVCSLDVFRLTDKPNFFALSYTWGSPCVDASQNKEEEQDIISGTQRMKSGGLDHSDKYSREPTPWIICNGQKLPIMKNLFEFLRHCSQSADKMLHGRMWIDALCINQENIPERSHQVNIMAEIYKAASGVLVWLGAEEPATQLQLQQQNKTTHEDEQKAHISQNSGALCSGDSLLPSGLATHGTTAAVNLINAIVLLSPEKRANLHPSNVKRGAPDLLIDLDHWQALALFFQRTWFSRAWIIQEVIFANKVTVLCGTHSLPWDQVAIVSRFLATSHWTNFLKDPEFFPSTSNSAISQWHNTPARLLASRKTWVSGSSDGLLYALIRCRPSECQDLRDKVYSQLRLGSADIFPDYNIPVAEVYIAAAKYIVEHTDNLFLLTCAEGDEFQAVPGLPSWVPDWSVTKFLGLRVTGYRHYSAAGNRPRKFQLSIKDSKHILSVEATKLDDIEEVGETKKGIRRDLSTLWMLLSGLKPKYISGQTREEVIWRTLMTNRESMPSDQSIQYPASNHMGESFYDWVLWRYAVGGKPEPPDYIDLPSSAHLPIMSKIREAVQASKKNPAYLSQLAYNASLFDLHYSHAMLLRPFRTKQGFFGLGTQCLQARDSVWIVPGCRVPLIFRNAEGTRYQLVGGSYVHGFMDGEALRRDGFTFEMVDLE